MVRLTRFWWKGLPSEKLWPQHNCSFLHSRSLLCKHTLETEGWPEAAALWWPGPGAGSLPTWGVGEQGLPRTLSSQEESTGLLVHHTVSRQCEVTLGVAGGVMAVPNGWRNIKNTYNSTLLQCSNSCSHCRNIYSNLFLQNNSTGCSWNDLVPKRDYP